MPRVVWTTIPFVCLILSLPACGEGSATIDDLPIAEKTELSGLEDEWEPVNSLAIARYMTHNLPQSSSLEISLTELTQRGDVTVDEMKQLQGDRVSLLGRKLATPLVAAVERAHAERDTPGTHPDLSAVVTDIGGDFDLILAMADKLDGWSYHTEPAVEGTPSADEIEDSNATCIFNATITRLVHLAFDDEVNRIGQCPGDGWIGKTLAWALLTPQRLNTYDADRGDTVLWDDLDTPEVDETRDERILRALHGALAFLREKLGEDMEGWRWGKLHTVRFEDIAGAFDDFSIPPPGDPDFPDGFPRHGDNFGVDAAHGGIWDDEDFSSGSGPQQRVAVEMTPRGPRVWNAYPGGQAHGPASPHHADEAELWRNNQVPPLHFTEEDVVEHAEQRVRFRPPS